jgi:hypothetical protein
LPWSHARHDLISWTARLQHPSVTLSLHHEALHVPRLRQPGPRATMVLTGDIFAPESPALPAIPADDFWSETEWAVFNAIQDTIVPAVVSKSSLIDKQAQLAIPDGEYSAVVSRARTTALQSQDEASLRAFMEDKATTHPAVREVSLRIVARLTHVQKDGLRRLLKSLSSAPSLS